MTYRTDRPLPKASAFDTARIVAQVVAPPLAKGPVIRRPKMVGLVERFDLDTGAVRTMQRLRDRYGPGPLMVPLPGPPRALLLEPSHVFEVLDGAPEPFTPASSEKRAALSHFQPDGVLITRGPLRAERRAYNEKVLGHTDEVHPLAEPLLRVVGDEMHALLRRLPRGGVLTWKPFFDAWFRVVRRVIFGDAARDDTELTDMSFALRGDGNWVMLKPKREALRKRFQARIEHYVRRAEPGSLAGVMSSIHAAPQVNAPGQVPHWLFAIDAAVITTFRSLALLASHPRALAVARAEVREKGGVVPVLPFLRATVLESLRLWPTTPMVLRQSTRATRWAEGVMPADTGVVIFASFFHRDETRLPFAHRFAPDIWLEHGFSQPWPLIPFSQGPAICPARHLVLMLTSAALASVIRDYDLALPRPHPLNRRGDLPGTLDHFRLRFQVRPR